MDYCHEFSTGNFGKGRAVRRHRLYGIGPAYYIIILHSDTASDDNNCDLQIFVLLFDVIDIRFATTERDSTVH